jgi:hypothetical protein
MILARSPSQYGDGPSNVRLSPERMTSSNFAVAAFQSVLRFAACIKDAGLAG